MPPVNSPICTVEFVVRMDCTSASVWLNTVLACGCVRCACVVVLCRTGSRFGVIAPTC